MHHALPAVLNVGNSHWMVARLRPSRKDSAPPQSCVSWCGYMRYLCHAPRTAHDIQVCRGCVQGSGVPLASDQVQYSLLYREPERNGVLDTCRELGITLMAYSPLCQGLLTGVRRHPTASCQLWSASVYAAACWASAAHGARSAPLQCLLPRNAAQPERQLGFLDALRLGMQHRRSTLSSVAS